MNLEVGKTYTFSTRAPALLGQTIERVRLTSIMDFQTANLKENISRKFRNIYPTLPEGTPDDPEAALYYGFRTEFGQDIIVANFWIDEESLVEISLVKAVVTFPSVSLSDITTLRNILNASGMGTFNINVIEG